MVVYKSSEGYISIYLYIWNSTLLYLMDILLLINNDL